MKVLSLSILSTLLFCCFSCNNNEFDGVKNEFSELNETRSNNELTTKFIYHGKTYESSYEIINDSLKRYNNPDVEMLAQKFDASPTLTSFYYPNHEIEYFDSEEELDASFDRIKEKVENIYNQQKLSYFVMAANSRVIIDDPSNPVDIMNHDAELWLYDDVAYLDRREDLYLQAGEKIFEWPHLKDKYNMNDKTSSFCAISIGGFTRFNLYEDDNYRSHCMSIIVGNQGDPIDVSKTPYSLSSLRLTNYAYAIDLKECEVLGTKRSSWNDRITSVRIERLFSIGL